MSHSRKGVAGKALAALFACLPALVLLPSARDAASRLGGTWGRGEDAGDVGRPPEPRAEGARRDEGRDLLRGRAARYAEACAAVVEWRGRVDRLGRERAPASEIAWARGALASSEIYRRDAKAALAELEAGLARPGGEAGGIESEPRR